MLDAQKPHHRADEHHPLDAEVEHAGALREQLAERGEQKGGAVGDGGREDDHDDPVVHPDASGAGVATRPDRSSTKR